jgi:salicylate hydroxylase
MSELPNVKPKRKKHGNVWTQKQLSTTPQHLVPQHLGEGASQCMEDIGLLIDLLEKHNPSASVPSSEMLEKVFIELEEVRIPRTAELVKRARAQGETRVVSGTEAYLSRNKWYRELLSDETLLKQRFGA